MTPTAAGASTTKTTTEHDSVGIRRRHTRAGEDVYALFKWDRRTAVITDDSGKVIFEQQGVEVPAAWSDLALQVVASKYFTGHLGTPERESSIRQLVGRVARTIAGWGRTDGYFRDGAEGDAFEDELTYLLLSQRAAFNSPVWFNVGVRERPQCSACFINSVQDSMESIMDLAKTEAMLFKYGSGTGTNLSVLRSSREPLRGGGRASGPVSFMRGYDAFANVIKSGGKTRRAAKMVILEADHPDILEFVDSKMNEERKAQALIDAGYDGGVNGEAYSSVFFQNANHSVRVTDAFMKAVQEDRPWNLRAVTTGETIETLPAREVMGRITRAAHACGDPGLQFDDAIQRWHTCKASGRIRATNPCSEYVFLDDTACNLASINLLKYLGEDGTFDVEGYRHACEVMITAQEIVVDRASYPTQAIEQNSHDFRPLGLGYANLGALLMHLGLPYDSPEARGWCGALTAIMNASAYARSARMAERLGPFAAFAANRESMLEVMRAHRAAVDRIEAADRLPSALVGAARSISDEAVTWGERFGFRNAQATVLAPTGTIAFMMDCDTTGIEPDIALIKYKRLSGGGTLKIVNRSVRPALRRLGYAAHEVDAIVEHLDREETIEGAPYLKKEHLMVFDCAFRARGGSRTIKTMGHLRMMAAAQPFLSGAISKTVNLPNDTTPEEIGETYMEAWRLGLKAVAIYRDGCKRAQPLSTTKKGEAAAAPAIPVPVRRRLPADRQAMTHRFEVAGHEGYITVGLYDDGRPGEIFLKMSKEGSTISGLVDTIATLSSIALQYGVPLEALVRKFSHVRFEPAGLTRNPEIPMAKSIVDYTFRWLASKFLDEESRRAVGVIVRERPSAEKEPAPVQTRFSFQNQADAPACSTCGAITIRSGSCYLCPECGSTSGCS